MPAPTISTPVNTTGISQIGFTIDLPASIPVGDLILVVCGYYDNTQRTPVYPSGYVELFRGFNTGGFFAFYKIADGSEGATITLGTVQGSFAASVYVISDFVNETPFIESSSIAYQAGSDSIGFLDAPSVTATWGANQNLFLVTGLVTRNPTADWTAQPAGYTNTAVWSGSDGGGYSALISSGHKTATSAIDDPGTYEDGTFKQYTAATIVIKGQNTDPSVSLDAPPTYGETISGTYENFSGVPAASNNLSITDGTRTITVAVTVTDNGNGTGSFTGTMPSLPTAGNSVAASSLLYPGSVDVTLTDPGV